MPDLTSHDDPSAPRNLSRNLASPLAAAVRSLGGPLSAAVRKLKNELLIFLVVLGILIVFTAVLRTRLAVELQVFFGFMAFLGVSAYVALRLIPEIRSQRQRSSDDFVLKGNVFQSNRPARDASLSVVGMSGSWSTDRYGFFLIPLAPFGQTQSIHVIIEYNGATHIIEVSMQQIPVHIDLPEAAVADGPSAATAPPSKKSQSRLKLAKQSPSSKPWSFESDKEIVTIGRAPDCDVVLEDSKASWHHGFIERVTGEYVYHHTSETNPTIIRRRGEETLLTKSRKSKSGLRNSDRIVVGQTQLLVEFDLTAGAPGYVTTEKDE